MKKKTWKTDVRIDFIYLFFCRNGVDNCVCEMSPPPLPRTCNLNLVTFNFVTL